MSVKSCQSQWTYECIWHDTIRYFYVLVNHTNNSHTGQMKFYLHPFKKFFHRVYRVLANSGVKLFLTGSRMETKIVLWASQENTYCTIEIAFTIICLIVFYHNSTILSVRKIRKIRWNTMSSCFHFSNYSAYLLLGLLFQAESLRRPQIHTVKALFLAGSYTVLRFM